MWLILKTIRDDFVAEGSISSPPVLLSFFRFWYGPDTTKGMHYEICEH